MGIQTAAAIGKMSCECFDDTMYYWEQHCKSIFKKIDGEEYIERFAEYLEKNGFPCNRVVVNPFTHAYVQDNKYRLTLQIDKKEICTIDVKVERYGIQTFQSTYKDVANVYLKCYLDKIIRGWFNYRNGEVFADYLIPCNLKVDDEGKYSVTIVYNDNYKPTDTKQILVGTIEEIFDVFTDKNETYKYCNGTYYTFENKEVETLYRVFTSMDRNYFLMNAVKHGRLID